MIQTPRRQYSLRARHMLTQVTGRVSGIDTEAVATGQQKWWGLAAVGTMLYAAPREATEVLVGGGSARACSSDSSSQVQQLYTYNAGC